MGVKVRVATLDDVDALVELGRLMHAESPRYQYRSFDPEKVAAFARAVVPSGGTHIAENNGTIIGMFSGYVVEDWFGHYRTASDFVVYVRPEFRGGSAFVRLVRAFEKWAISQGAEELCPGVSSGVHTALTVSMFERLGYRQLEARVLTKGVG